MNRVPDRLRCLVVVVLCVRVICTVAENDVAGARFKDLGKSRREPARVLHRADPYPGPKARRPPTSALSEPEQAKKSKVP